MITKKEMTDNITLYNDNCFNIFDKIPDESIKVVVLDPPYAKQCLNLYIDILPHIYRILQKGGSYFAIIPQHTMPKIIEETSKVLKWRWIICINQEKYNHARLSMGIEVMWKPMGWWVKGSFQRKSFMKDMVFSDREKTLHGWQQSLSWASYCLQVTSPGDTVLDPFMGTGTVGVACKKLGRNFIGIELDKETFEIAKKRIEEVD